MNQEDIPTRGGPSSSTVRKIEAASSDRYQARIMFQLDEALAWGKGTSQEIVEGPRDWMGAFQDFIDHVVKDTRAAERRGDDYPVGWQPEGRPREDLDFIVTGADGTPFRFLEAKASRTLSSVSDDELIAELAARLKRRSNAQAPEPIEGTRGQASGSSSGGGAPIAPPEESMEKLRELDAGVTERSRTDPKSG